MGSWHSFHRSSCVLRAFSPHWSCWIRKSWMAALLDSNFSSAWIDHCGSLVFRRCIDWNTIVWQKIRLYEYQIQAVLLLYKSHRPSIKENQRSESLVKRFKIWWSEHSALYTYDIHGIRRALQSNAIKEWAEGEKVVVDSQEISWNRINKTCWNHWLFHARVIKKDFW